ncbi:MAG TPA: hypothetical protein VFK80_11440 [Limnochordia bacterium]|nr:hypothetical protein [Limnochordia bacterium]
MKRRLLGLVLGIAAALSLTGAAFAATLVDDGFASLDSSVWRTWNASDNGKVAASGGVLEFSGVDGGWKQTGLMLKKPVDLTKGAVSIEVDYKSLGFTQQPVGLWNNGTVDGEDTWNYAGFRLTVGPTSIHPEITPPCDCSFNSTDADPQISAPAAVVWTITPKAGTVYDTTIAVNGQNQYTGTLDIGSLDAKAMYVYLYVSNNDGTGPTDITHVKITQ